MSDTATATANIGVVGLAVMGSNLARNLASREGNTVAVYNRSPERTDAAALASTPRRASCRPRASKSSPRR